MNELTNEMRTALERVKHEVSYAFDNYTPLHAILDVVDEVYEERGEGASRMGPSSDTVEGS